MQNITCERSFHRSSHDLIHRSLCAPRTETSPARERRIEASRVVVLEMVELAAMRSVSCMVLMLNVRQRVRICSRSAKKVKCCSLKYRRYYCYTQRFGVTGWARAHPGKSITRSSGSLSSYVVLARQLTGFEISAHCTQPSSEQATMLADVPKQACVPLNTSPKTAAPGLASSSD